MKIHFHQTAVMAKDWDAVKAQVQTALSTQALHIFPFAFLWGVPPGREVADPQLKNAYRANNEALIALAQQAVANSAMIIAPGINEQGQGEFLLLTAGQGGRWFSEAAVLAKALSAETGITLALGLDDDHFHQAAQVFIRWGQRPFAFNRPPLAPAIFGGAYFVLNPVGLGTEALWAGHSYGHCQNFVQLPFGKPGEIVLDTANTKSDYLPAPWQERAPIPLRWTTDTPPRLSPLTEKELTLIEDALIFGLQAYAEKNGRPKFLVALSGGLDSAYVLAILAQAIKAAHIEAIYMPSTFSAPLSGKIAEQLAKNLKIKLWYAPIKFPHKVLAQHLGQIFGSWEGLPDENLQARLRMIQLYARANQTGAHVLNTSNKSEIAMGYATLYGDSVGACSPLGDLFKTEIFALARHYNQRFGQLLPEEVITRPPSAELHPDQRDDQTLPPYEILDPLLEGLLSYQKTPQDLYDAGFAPEVVQKVVHQWKKTSYKRQASVPLLRLREGLFGLGKEFHY